METPEINIAEILQGCPKGTKLYSPALGVVEYSHCKNNRIFVIDNDGNEREFFADGRLNDEGECMLLPSKEQRDWSRFEPPVKPPFAVNKNLCEYYAFDMFGRVKLLTNEHNGLDNELWSFGNRFDTGEQAEYAAEKVKDLLLSLRKE